MTTNSSEGLMHAAREVAAREGVSLFRAFNLVTLPYLDEVADHMTDVQREALVVAGEFWRDGSRTSEELVTAQTAVWEAMMRIAPDLTIIGLEVHMARALLGVLAPEFDEHMGEEWFCRELADWFPRLMWDWCDLTVDECFALSVCLRQAALAGRYPRATPGPFRPSLAALLAAYQLRREARPGVNIDIAGFDVSVTPGVPENPSEFGDVSIIGQAVQHMEQEFTEEKLYARFKIKSGAWARLRSLFSRL